LSRQSSSGSFGIEDQLQLPPFFLPLEDGRYNNGDKGSFRSDHASFPAIITFSAIHPSSRLFSA
jgi:hypothetical protein